MDHADKTMEKIVALCKGRGFVYPGSEIYGGLANAWDYGPLGAALKKNVKEAWWKKFIQKNPYNVGVDCAILMNTEVWKASGHVVSFNDPLIDCKSCKMRYRADNLVDDYNKERGIEMNADGLPGEVLTAYIKENNIVLSAEALDAVGILFTKLCYRNWENLNCPGILMNGGARNTRHFTELVGAKMHATVNYPFLEQMNKDNPPIESRYELMYPDAIKNELLNKLPYFSQAIEKDSMEPKDFDTYLPFVYFRKTFTEAWQVGLEFVKEQRAVNSP